jgi:hypothetical protein
MAESQRGLSSMELVSECTGSVGVQNSKGRACGICVLLEFL